LATENYYVCFSQVYFTSVYYSGRSTIHLMVQRKQILHQANRDNQPLDSQQ
jgi:hypothetical protein